MQWNSRDNHVNINHRYIFSSVEDISNTMSTAAFFRAIPRELMFPSGLTAVQSVGPQYRLFPACMDYCWSTRSLIELHFCMTCAVVCTEKA